MHDGDDTRLTDASREIVAAIRRMLGDAEAAARERAERRHVRGDPDFDPDQVEVDLRVDVRLASGHVYRGAQVVEVGRRCFWIAEATDGRTCIVQASHVESVEQVVEDG